MRNSTVIDQERLPKILIVSDATWADDNNIGATFSNLFQNYPKEKLAMIYARPDLPNTSVCDNFFQISESRLIKSLFLKRIKPGIRVANRDMNVILDSTLQEEKNGKNMYNLFRKFRFNSLLLIRELLWEISDWKTPELNDFIDEFQPDIILSLACASVYTSNIQNYVIEYSKSKSVVYFVDDVYSTKQISLSVFFWINKFFIRKNIKKLVQISDRVYTIIPKQKEEYDKYFNVSSVILNKGGDFNEIMSSSKMEFPLNIIYTGNIYAGRWEMLVKLGEILEQINQNNEKIILSVYTKNLLTKKMKQQLSEINSIKFKGAISAEDVSSIQDSADILLHVESLKLREKLLTRLSFSTKLVDYFEKNRAILAIGWEKSASIQYLQENDIALVIDDLDKMSEILQEIMLNPKILISYGEKAWVFGKKEHDINKIQVRMIKDLEEISKK